MATFEDFQKLDIRVGKIIEVEEPDSEDKCVLLIPDTEVPLGGKLY